MEDDGEFDERELDLLHRDLVDGGNVSRRVIWKSAVPKEAVVAHRDSNDEAKKKASSAASRPQNGFGRIRVIIRCRPLLDKEKGHKTERLSIEEDAVVVRHPVTQEGKRFGFDRVLPPEAEQHDVFGEIQPMIEHVLNGFHATVFAYGQTGSGKTYTMDGLTYNITKQGNAMVPIPDPESPVQNHGILLRVIQMIFDVAAARQKENTDSQTGEPKQGCPKFEFKCSFLQIYNEKITDLLQSVTGSGSNTRATAADNSLRLQWLKGDVFRPQNLFLCECDTANKMRDSFFKGVKEKVVASHMMNQQSSRSHTIFTIYVIRRDASTGDILSRSEFSLVDLAGSEKLNAVATDAKSRIAKESIEINTSLLALGKVILALANAKGKKGVHVPYRESKLTKLLKHAIGGNSLTTMIACISPSDNYIDESVSTMLYAGRAKNIENAPKVNEDPNYAIIRQLREEIRQLKQELEYYRVLATSGVHRTGQLLQEGAPGQPVEPQVQSSPGKDVLVLSETDNQTTFQEKNELADSLLAACEMLNQIIGVNGQLREAYDVLKKEGEESATREMHLNAENLALRERIEMLESIVLSDEMLDANGRVKKPEDIEEEDDASEEEQSEETGSDETEEEDEKEEEEVKPVADFNPRFHHSPRSEIDISPVRRPASALSVQSEISTLPAFDAGGYRKAIQKDLPGPAFNPAATAIYTPEKVAQENYLDTYYYRPRTSPPEKPERMNKPPGSAKPAGAGSGRFPTSSRPQQKSSARTPTSQRPGAPKKSATTRTAELIYGSKKARKPSPQKKQKKQQRKQMASKLQEYDRRYRQPAPVPTYADYYGRARPSQSSNKSNKTIEEMDQVLKKLPPELAQEIVPYSLKLNGRFGDLNFVGDDREIAELKQKRMEREAKLRSLLLKNRELTMMVHSELEPQGASRDRDAHRPSSYDRRGYGGNAPQIHYAPAPRTMSSRPAGRPNTTSGVVRQFKESRTLSSSGRMPLSSSYDDLSTRPQFNSTLPPSRAYVDKGVQQYNNRLRSVLKEEENRTKMYYESRNNDDGPWS